MSIFEERLYPDIRKFHQLQGVTMNDQRKTEIALQLVEILCDNDLELDELERALRLPKRYAEQLVKDMKVAAIDTQYIDSLLSESALAMAKRVYVLTNFRTFLMVEHRAAHTELFVEIESTIDFPAIVLSALEEMGSRDIETLALYLAHPVVGRRTPVPEPFKHIVEKTNALLNPIIEQRRVEAIERHRQEEQAERIKFENEQRAADEADRIAKAKKSAEADAVIIEDLPDGVLNVRCKTGLRNAGIKNLAEVASQSEMSIRDIRLIGDTSIGELRKLLNDHGLEFKAEE